MELRGLAQALNLDPLRLLEGQGVLQTLLAEKSGADIEALLLAQSAEGLLLQLEGGRTLVASGELPFPDGTRLLLRAVPTPDLGFVRLQPMAATPPAPPPLLVPLHQGEASPLLQKLLSDAPLPTPFEPLRSLLQQVISLADPAPPPQPSLAPLPPAHEPAPLPSEPLAPEMQAFRPTPPPLKGMELEIPTPQAAGRETLETPLLPALSKDAGGEAQPALARGVPASALEGATSPAVPPSLSSPTPRAWLSTYLEERGLPPAEAKAWAARILPEEASTDPAVPKDAPFPAGLAKPTVPSPAAGDEVAEDTLSHLPQPIAPRRETVTADGDSKRITPELVLEDLKRAQVPDALLPRLLPLLINARNTPSPGPLEQLLQALIPRPTAWTPASRDLPLPTQASARATPLLAPDHGAIQDWARADTWEQWMRGTTSALTDAQVSPREAPFHALQAREGTALFELPLPLPQLRGAVELWIEQDRDASGPNDPGAVRVLLALEMEGMGQMRLGVVGHGSQIQADLWVDEGKQAAIRLALQAELGEPPPYALRVRSFRGPQPSLRHVAGAGPFGAIG